MFDFWPHTYTFLYFHFILIIVLVACLRIMTKNLGYQKKYNGIILALIITLFIGLRPFYIWGAGKYFGDTGNYYRTFLEVADGNEAVNFKDIGFELFTKFFAEYSNAGIYFFMLALLYVWPLYLISRRLKINNSYLLFLAIISSFMFWSNGVNGIRIGIATSWFILALTYNENKLLQAALIVLAIIFHKSILLPTLAYAFTFFYTNTKGYILIWFASILLSLLFGNYWTSFFAGLNLSDERLSEYLINRPTTDLFRYTGFRWDFLIYSAVPVVFGAYIILKKKFTDKFYIQLFNTYLLANSFWILVIRANYSNRFASLSWFLIPLILLLPLLSQRLFKYQNIKIAYILLISFAFTYYMSFDSIWK